MPVLAAILAALANVAKLYDFSEAHQASMNMPILILLSVAAVGLWLRRRHIADERAIAENLRHLSTPGSLSTWYPSGAGELRIARKMLRRGLIVPSSHGGYIAAAIHHMTMRFGARRRLA